MQDAGPIVSVIMLSYNHGSVIRNAIDSVLMQKTDFSFELLIGDDASQDDSPEILREYAERYPDVIRLVQREENIGTTKNAYDLMTRARGKYLASCESDDYWTDELKLQKQVDFLEAHGEYVGCTHPVISVDMEGNELPQQKIRWISSKKVYTFRDFKGIVLPGHSCSIVRRNIFLEPKYDTSILWRASPLIGDRTTALMFSAYGDFYRLDEPMACYRRELSKENRSVTWQLYHRDNWIEKELEFSERLEEYAQNELKRDAGTEYYKRRLFVSAVYKALKSRSREDRQTVRKVLSSLKHPVIAFLIFPWLVLEKIADRNKI